MAQLFNRKLLVEVIAGLFILLFVYTALSKLLHFHAFQLVLSRLPLVGKASLAAALLIPSVELLVAILLFLPLTRRFGLAATALLMILFALYVAYMMASEPRLPCSCGGFLKSMSWPVHLAFNCAAAVAALMGWRLQAMEERQWLRRLDQSFTKSS